MNVVLWFGNEAQSEPVGLFIYFFFVRDEIVLVAVVEGGWRKGVSYRAGI